MIMPWCGKIEVVGEAWDGEEAVGGDSADSNDRLDGHQHAEDEWH